MSRRSSFNPTVSATLCHLKGSFSASRVRDGSVFIVFRSPSFGKVSLSTIIYPLTPNPLLICFKFHCLKQPCFAVCGLVSEQCSCDSEHGAVIVSLFYFVLVSENREWNDFLFVTISNWKNQIPMFFLSAWSNALDLFISSLFLFTYMYMF